MAIGDLKGSECVVIEVTAGATVTVGQVVFIQPVDMKWDPAVTTSVGKFGVALDAAADTEKMRVCIWGRVEVTATAAAIGKGELVEAGNTGLVAAAVLTVFGEVVGTAMEAFGSGETHTIWVGLGA